MDANDSSKPCQAQVSISFQSKEAALMVKQCMDVDDELQPIRLTKDIAADGQSLVM